MKPERDQNAMIYRNSQVWELVHIRQRLAPRLLWPAAELVDLGRCSLRHFVEGNGRCLIAGNVRQNF